MSFKLRKPSLSSGAIVGAVGAALVVGSAGGAYAGHLIHTRDIAAHAVTWTKLDGNVQHKINKAGPRGPRGLPGKNGTNGTDGKDGADGADGVALAGQVTPSARVTIAHIGGRYADNATPVGTMTLPEGTYLINGDASFDRSSAGDSDAAVQSAKTQLQLNINGQDGSTWGSDLGGCITGYYPAGDHEITCSTSRLVTIPAGGQTIDVKVFGYNEDASDTGSGMYDAAVNVSALKVTTPAAAPTS